jgi:hypothetical protein
MLIRDIPMSRCQKCGDHVTLSRFVTDYVCPRCQRRQDEHEQDAADLTASLDVECAGAPLSAQEWPLWTALASDEYCRGRQIVREREALP